MSYLTPAAITDILLDFDNQVRGGLNDGNIGQVMGAIAKELRKFYQSCAGLEGPRMDAFKAKYFLHVFLGCYRKNGSKCDPAFLKEMKGKLEKWDAARGSQPAPPTPRKRAESTAAAVERTVRTTPAPAPLTKLKTPADKTIVYKPLPRMLPVGPIHAAPAAVVPARPAAASGTPAPRKPAPHIPAPRTPAPRTPTPAPPAPASAPAPAPAARAPAPAPRALAPPPHIATLKPPQSPPARGSRTFRDIQEEDDESAMEVDEDKLRDTLEDAEMEEEEIEDDDMEVIDVDKSPRPTKVQPKGKGRALDNAEVIEVDDSQDDSPRPRHIPRKDKGKGKAVDPDQSDWDEFKRNPTRPLPRKNAATDTDLYDPPCTTCALAGRECENINGGACLPCKRMKRGCSYAIRTRRPKSKARVEESDAGDESGDEAAGDEPDVVRKVSQRPPRKAGKRAGKAIRAEASTKHRDLPATLPKRKPARRAAAGQRAVDAHLDNFEARLEVLADKAEQAFAVPHDLHFEQKLRRCEDFIDRIRDAVVALCEFNGLPAAGLAFDMVRPPIDPLPAIHNKSVDILQTRFCEQGVGPDEAEEDLPRVIGRVEIAQPRPQTGTSSTSNLYSAPERGGLESGTERGREDKRDEEDDGVSTPAAGPSTLQRLTTPSPGPSDDVPAPAAAGQSTSQQAATTTVQPAADTSTTSATVQLPPGAKPNVNLIPATPLNSQDTVDNPVQLQPTPPQVQPAEVVQSDEPVDHPMGITPPPPPLQAAPTDVAPPTNVDEPAGPSNLLEPALARRRGRPKTPIPSPDDTLAVPGVQTRSQSRSRSPSPRVLKRKGNDDTAGASDKKKPRV